MGKSIRLSNDIYLDSRGIVHNKKKLSEILYEEKILWEGSSSSVVVEEKLTDYNKLIIKFNQTWDEGHYGTLIIDEIIDEMKLSFFDIGSPTRNIKVARATLNNYKIVIDTFAQINNNESWSVSNSAGSFVITKVIGYKKTS